MAIRNQRFNNLGIWVGEGANKILIGCAKSFSLDATIEEIETSCRAPGSNKEYEPGDADFSGSVDGGMRVATGTDAAGNVTYENIFDMAVAKTVTTFSFGGTQVGDATWSGKGFFTSANMSASQGEQGSFSASFRISGNLTKGIVA